MSAPGILESLFPDYDARERHEVNVRAPAQTTYEALYRANFGRSPVVRLLLALRSLPFSLRRRSWARRHKPSAPGVRSLQAAGFGLIAERHGSEVVLGIAGTFWELVPRATPLDAATLNKPPPHGSAYAAWNFAVTPIGESASRLSTETRVLVGDRGSRRRFRAYWFLVRPFSGLIRRSLLRAVKDTAERTHRRIDFPE